MTIAEWSEKTGVDLVRKSDWVMVKPATVEAHKLLFELSDMEPVAITGGTIFLAARLTERVVGEGDCVEN